MVRKPVWAITPKDPLSMVLVDLACIVLAWIVGRHPASVLQIVLVCAMKFDVSRYGLLNRRGAGWTLPATLGIVAAYYKFRPPRRKRLIAT